MVEKQLHIKTIFDIPTYKKASCGSMLNSRGIRGRKTDISLCFIRSINHSLSKNIYFSRVNRFRTVSRYHNASVICRPI